MLLSKSIKHVPGKKSAVGDKPAARKREGVMDLGRMPLVRGVSTVDEYKSQQATVSITLSRAQDQKAG